MAWCNLIREADGRIVCQTCEQPYVLSAKERQQWQGDLSKSRRDCQKPAPVTPGREVKQAPPRPEAPPWYRQLKNLTRATIQHVYNRLPTCTDEQIAQRHAICRACPLYLPHDEEPEIGICTHEKCGCTLKMARRFFSKLGWADQSCPLGKWPAITKGGE